MWIDTHQTYSRPWDLNSIISTVIPSSQQCSKKRNFFDAPNSNFPLLNWLDIIVHRIESICKDRPMSRLHIFVLENWHVQLLYRPTYQFSRKLLRNKVVFQSLLCQKFLDPDFLSTFLVVTTCFGLLLCCTMSHMTYKPWNCKFCFPTQLQWVLALCEFHYCEFHYCGFSKLLLKFG